jgi:elongation factor P hydroxylase
MFMKVKSQQGPKEATFRLRFHEDVVKRKGNSLNTRRDNFLDSLLGFFATHLSEARGYLKLGV